MMRISFKIVLVLVVFLSMMQIAKAMDEKKEPLRVSVTYFTPPFLTSIGYNSFMGFDINMLNYICNYLKRDCQYNPTKFAGLIPSILNNQADIAAGGIIITPDRLLEVAMSNPYLVSASRFITYYDNKVSKLNDKVLINTKIGVEKGSAFRRQLKNMEIKGIKIVEFDQEADEIQALMKHHIDFALMDNYASIYWVNHSGNKLKLIGKSIIYGYGYGIAINPRDSQLINDINEAVNAYIHSDKYRENYNFYLSDF